MAILDGRHKERYIRIGGGRSVAAARIISDHRTETEHQKEIIRHICVRILTCSYFQRSARVSKLGEFSRDDRMDATMYVREALYTGRMTFRVYSNCFPTAVEDVPEIEDRHASGVRQKREEP
jgi:hypothetical protein